MFTAGHFNPARRRLLHCASAVLATSGLGGAALLAQAQRPSAALAGQPLRVAVCGRQTLGHLPLVLAQRLGLFDAEGLWVELVEVATEEAVFQAVQQGHAHLAACAYPLAIAQHARGTAWRSLVLQTRTPMAVLGVSARQLGAPAGVGGWRGQRVGLLEPGPADMVLAAVLRRAQVLPAQVSWVRGDDAFDLVQRFRRGELDALCTTDVGVWALEQQGAMRVLADTRTQRGTHGVFGGPLPGKAVCAPEAWAIAHPDLAQKMANGLVHALKWLTTAGPADLIRALPDAHFQGARTPYLKAIEQARDGFSPDGVLTADSANTAMAVLGQLDPHVRTAWVDLGKTYTNEFALRAKTRFRV